MPSSYFIPEIIPLATTLPHGSILDIGPGFGKYGMLLREYLEIWAGRYHKKDWKVRIDCIEVFEEYITPIHKHIYDQIYIGNAEKIINELRSYDLILILDVIEHMDKEVGVKFIDECKKKCSAIVIATPKGFTSQGPYLGNQFEIHKSGWEKEEFEVLGFKSKAILRHDKILTCWEKK